MNSLLAARRRCAWAGLIWLLAMPNAAAAHTEPPKTRAERSEQAAECAIYAAAGVRTQALREWPVAAADTAGRLILVNTFDRAGRQVEQVVADPERAERSAGRYDPEGNWLGDDTWRDGVLSERTVFEYDADSLVRHIISEDLVAGTREELRYETRADRDEIVVVKTGPGETLQYTIRYRYEPGSNLTRLAEAVQTGPDGAQLLRVRHTHADGHPRVQAMHAADDSLAWTMSKSYTAAGDLQEIVRRDATGALVSRQVRTYRPDRLPDMVTDYDAAGAVTRRRAYSYVFFADSPASR